MHTFNNAYRNVIFLCIFIFCDLKYCMTHINCINQRIFFSFAKQYLSAALFNLFTYNIRKPSSQNCKTFMNLSMKFFLLVLQYNSVIAKNIYVKIFVIYYFVASCNTEN